MGISHSQTIENREIWRYYMKGRENRSLGGNQHMVLTGWICLPGLRVGTVLYTGILVVQSRKERKSWSGLRQRRSSENKY